MNTSKLVLALLLGVPALMGVIAALARIASAEKWADNLDQWINAKHAAFQAGPSTWMRNTGKTLLWPFKVVFEWTGHVKEANWRAGLRIMAFFYLVFSVVASVLLVLYVAIVVALSVAALYLGYKVLAGLHSQTTDESEGSVELPRAPMSSAGPSYEAQRSSAAPSFWISTVKCRSCGATVSTDVDTCPQCREDLSQFKLFGSPPVVCRSCHATVSEDTAVCPQCGEDLQQFKFFGSSPRKCRVCHATVSEDTVVCPQCGENVDQFKLFGASPRKCRACGVTVSEDESVCHKCGEEQESFKLFGTSTGTCRACGATVSEDATRCRSCGEDLVAFKAFG